jgi:hypothetical protein
MKNVAGSNTPAYPIRPGAIPIVYARYVCYNTAPVVISLIEKRRLD